MVTRKRTSMMMLAHDYFYVLAMVAATAIVTIVIFGGFG
jgi:hypothetical protein